MHLRQILVSLLYDFVLSLQLPAYETFFPARGRLHATHLLCRWDLNSDSGYDSTGGSEIPLAETSFVPGHEHLHALYLSYPSGSNLDLDFDSKGGNEWGLEEHLQFSDLVIVFH
mmetsp:Transcript_1870/g.3340  ORF Transcript_1870/g.3340 Transcript_1870/m.3340 type:complete len:114 (+) Transcript_1870:650-991(+)